MPFQVWGLIPFWKHKSSTKKVCNDVSCSWETFFVYRTSERFHIICECESTINSDFRVDDKFYRAQHRFNVVRHIIIGTTIIRATSEPQSSLQHPHKEPDFFLINNSS